MSKGTYGSKLQWDKFAKQVKKYRGLIILFLLFIVGIVTAQDFSEEQREKRERSQTTTIVTSTELYRFMGDCEDFYSCERLINIRDAIEAWDERFECNAPFAVHPIGRIEADPGEVKLDESKAGEMGIISVPYPEEMVEFAVAHAMLHVCQPEGYELLEESFVLDSHTIIGTEGLQYITPVTNAQGEHEHIGMFEEGLAELLATEIYGRVVPDDNYERLYDLTRLIWDSRDLETYPDMAVISEWASEHDPNAFVAMALHVEPDEVTLCDISGLLHVYEAVMQGADTPEEGFASLETYRALGDERDQMCSY